MDTSLDFVSRARHAWQELRHPSAHDPLQHSNVAEREEDGRPASSQLPVPPIDPSVSLTQFRLLVGIYQDKSFAPPRGWLMNRRPQASVQHRPAPNLGIYTTVCEKEITAKRNYKHFSKLVNCCLGLQLIVAAALTALGAANGNRAAVTVFGAINTVIAGFLTYLKGSGLPNRLKYFQHEWAKVREYIEQKERDFMLGVHGLDVRTEVESVRRMYEAVKQDIQTNTPERFVSASQLASQLQSAAHPPPPPVARPQPSLSGDSLHGKWLNEKEVEANTAQNRGHGGGHGMLSKFGHLKDILEDKVKDLGQMEKDIESNGHRAYDEGRRGLQDKHDQIHSNLNDVAYLGKEIETGARATAAQQAQQLSQRQQDAQAAVARSSEAARDSALAQRDAAVNTAGQYTDAATAAVNAQRDAAIHAIGQSSNAATAAIAGQRDAIHTALHGHEQPRPPPTS